MESEFTQEEARFLDEVDRLATARIPDVKRDFEQDGITVKNEAEYRDAAVAWVMDDIKEYARLVEQEEYYADV